MIRKLVFATTFFVAACTAPYTLPSNDRAEIEMRVASFERAFVEGNTTEIINIIPPA